MRAGDRVGFFHDGFVRPSHAPGDAMPYRVARVVRVHPGDRLDLDVPLQKGDTLPGGDKVTHQIGAVITNVSRCDGEPRTGTWKPIV